MCERFLYECVYECVYVCACLNMRVYKHMCVSVEARGTVHFMFLLGKLFAGLELPSRVGRLASWPGIPAICFSSHPVLGLYATIKTLLFVLFFYFGSGDPKLRSFGLQGKYCMDYTQPDGAISFMTGF